MSMKTELFLVPMSSHGGALRFLVRKDPAQNSHVLPHMPLRGDLFQRNAQEQLLRDILSSAPATELEEWLGSSRHRTRVVEVFDRTLLFEGAQSVAIVRAIAIPEDLAPDAKGSWLSAQEAFSDESLVMADSKLFVQECQSHIPFWVRNTTFAFELLPPVFSIQDLRVLVGMLSGQEIDAGNFHRRLKRLDVLRPLVSGQRVHRWEFAWNDCEILRTEGLIP